MAENSDPNQQQLENLKFQLMNQIVLISGDRESVWDSILEEQQLCTKIIAEQVISNGKFSEYHDLWMERSLSWPDEFLTYYRFNELDEETTSLGNWLQNFELKSQKAMDVIKEMLENFNTNVSYLNEVREIVLNSTDFSQLEAINLDNFQWVNPELIPNTQELNEEWNNKNLYQSINNCVLEMSQLFNSPADILAELERVSSEGSSSSRESHEGVYLGQ